MEFKDVITIFNLRFKELGYQKRKHVWYKKKGEIFSLAQPYKFQHFQILQ